MLPGQSAEANVTTVTMPGLGLIRGMLVLGDGTRMFSTSDHVISVLSSVGRYSLIAGDPQEQQGAFEDGKGTYARLNVPGCLTLDKAGNVLFSDTYNNAIRAVDMSTSVVKTLAGRPPVDNVVLDHIADNQENDVENDEKFFADGERAIARFQKPMGLVVAANGDIYVSDSANHAIRVVTLEGSVRTLCGNGQAGFADGMGAVARFDSPCGIALDLDENLLVADTKNNAIRRVNMSGEVTTLTGDGSPGFRDGDVSSARFRKPVDVKVDGQGNIIVADMGNNRLRKIVGDNVMTLAGSKKGDEDGPGSQAHFKMPCWLALDNRGRLLVAEFDRADTLRVVEATLTPPLWMGPEQKAAEVGKLWKTGRESVLFEHARKISCRSPPTHARTTHSALEDYGKILEQGEMSDVVLVVEGKRFHVHSLILSARSEYFRNMFNSRMHSGISPEGQEIREVSAEAFQAVLQYLYKAEMPVIAKGGAAGERGIRKEREKRGRRGKEKGEGGKGAEGYSEKSGKEVEETTRRIVFERELLKAADLFQLKELMEHCLKSFQQGLTVDTMVEQLVWAYTEGPAETRDLSGMFLAHNFHHFAQV